MNFRKLSILQTRLATSIIFFGNGFGIGAWAGCVTPLTQDLSLSVGQLSFILFGFAAGAFFALPASGFFATRIGDSAYLTKLCGASYALSLFLPSLAEGTFSLALSVFFIGAASGALDVSMNGHASEVERRWKRPIMSSFHAAYSLGGLSGTAWIALLLWYKMPLVSLMTSAAIVTVILYIWALTYLGPGAPPAPQTPLALPERKFIGLAVIALCCLVVEGAMIDWSGIYLSQNGANQSMAALGFATVSVAMVAGRILGDTIVHHYGRQRIILFGSALAGMGLCLVVIFPVIPMIYLGFCLVGLGLANVVPCSFSLAAKLGKTPTSGIAIVATAGYGGMVFGPVFIGLIANAVGLRTGMACLAVMAFLATLSALMQQTKIDSDSW